MQNKKNPSHVVMVASECRGFVKVGGLGDVVRDLSVSLAGSLSKVSVILPYYEIITAEARYVTRFMVLFAGREYSVRLFKSMVDGVDCYLVKNGEFFGGEYRGVYIDSSARGGGPFEDDAKRFAFFSTAVAEALQQVDCFETCDVLHCHDWHTGVLFVQLAFNQRFSSLPKKIKTFFTIHNLDYQGVRPFQVEYDSHLASFASWLPELYQLHCERGIFTGSCDVVGDPSCFNPMRAAINLADEVTTVSQSYAGEITQPDDPERNFAGGRGLEVDLRKRQDDGHLWGVLNGIDYSMYDPALLEPAFDLQKKDWGKKRDLFRANFLKTLPAYVAELAEQYGSRFPNSSVLLKQLAGYDLKKWLSRPLVVAVSRTAEQKMGLLLGQFSDGRTVLDRVIDADLSLILLGCGELDPQLGPHFNRKNALFLNLFDPQCAVRLYAAGDLFLMPSYFEPCGISQMVSMRYGCLPLVHDVGGLHDTVEDEKTGFRFSGGDGDQQRSALLESLNRALEMYKGQKRKWRAMQRAGMENRFTREKQAEKYIGIYS